MPSPATYGERAFSKVQYGKEVKTTHGTPVASTKIILGDVIAIASDRKIEFPEDSWGMRMKSDRSILNQYMAQGTLKIPNGYFQALPLMFSCGLKGDVTPTEQTGGKGDYLWLFNPSMTATNTPDSFTLQMGDNVQEFTTEYCMFNRLKLTGSIAQSQGISPVALEAEYFGRQLTKSTFTGGLAPMLTEAMNAKNTQIYVNSTWASVGTTEYTNSLRKYDLEILSGIHPKFLGSLDKFFTLHGESDLDFKLTLDLEETDLSNTIRDAHTAQTLAVVQLVCTGGVIPLGVNYKWTFAMSGYWESVTPLASQDRGNNITTAVLHGIYDPTGAQGCTCSCITTGGTTF